MSSHHLNSKTNLVLLLKTEVTETVSCRLSLRMAWMEMDLNLKKIGQFFRVLMLRVPKILKKFIMVSPHWFISYLRRSFEVMILAQKRIDLKQQHPHDTAPLKWQSLVHIFPFKVGPLVKWLRNLPPRAIARSSRQTKPEFKLPASRSRKPYL